MTLLGQSQPVAPSPIRLRRRRLYQGCALLLLLPTAAAFLPLIGGAPRHPVSLVPVPLPAFRLSASAPLVRAAHLAPPTPAHKPSRLARLSGLTPLSGLASWYGSVLGGHRTASGELFDPGALTACHPTLPFGTLVRVVNLLNHRSVTVRITDRGILSPTRVIDLSSAAAEQLDMLRSGVAPVRLEVQGMLRGKPMATTSQESDADSGS